MGSFAFRQSCYERYGWTPSEVKQALRDYPQECSLLSVYFEEEAFDQAKKNKKLAGSQGSSQTYAEEVIGDDDEVDWKDS